MLFLCHYGLASHISKSQFITEKKPLERQWNVREKEENRSRWYRTFCVSVSQTLELVKGFHFHFVQSADLWAFQKWESQEWTP